MKHCRTRNIESKRLILRKFTLNDALSMYKNWASDKEVTKYLTWLPHLNVTVTKNVIKNWVNNYSSDNYYKWAIILKENGNEPIGDISVVSLKEQESIATIGYCIGKFWWNKGITSEALKLVIDFLFDEIGLKEIEAEYDSNNLGSGKVMQKCGMQYKKTFYLTKENDKRCSTFYCYSIKNKKR